MANGNNGLDAFEQKLRESLDQFEVPYNSADWAQMEKALDGGRSGWWMSGLGLSSIAAGLLLIGGTTWYVSSGNGGTDTAVQVTEQVVDARVQPAVVEGTGTNTTQNANPAAPNTEAVIEAKDNTTAVTSNAADDVSASTVQNNRTARSGAEAPAIKKNVQPTSPAAVVPAAPNKESSMGTFKTSVSEGCSGTSVDFKVTNMPEDGIYLWNFGDGSFSNQPNPEHTFTKPGRYQVMLSMSAAGVGTIQNKPSSDMIVIHEAPSAAFNVLKQEYEGHLPSVHFENRSLGGNKYHWDFGDGQNSTIPHPDHIYKKKGVYQVELTVTNEIGCEDKIMKDVRIDKDYNLDARASFSPNGDGSEDNFIPEALRTLGVKFNFTVYGPNGNLIYQTNDATKPWTGRPQNRGDVCGEGEYTWVVDVRESLHLSETYSGKVRLVK